MHWDLRVPEHRAGEQAKDRDRREVAERRERREVPQRHHHPVQHQRVRDQAVPPAPAKCGARIGGGAVLVLLALLLWPSPQPGPTPGELPPQEGGFPVPPMDLQVPPSPRLARLEAQREPVSVGAGEESESS